MRILCTSDIHLGRIPHLPALPGEPLSHRTAWDFVRAAALEHRPDLLVLAGDVIDSDNQFLETWGPLRDGVLELLRAGISVAAVAGNHDSEVFPELHRVLQAEAGFPAGAAFHLLGLAPGIGRRSPAWTYEKVRLAGEELWLAGWSFPERTFYGNALDSFIPAPDSTPVLGLLHGELDVPGSHHGPLRRADLAAAPVAQWVLGHIHLPTGAEGGKHFYCGSPFPLRSNERGAHGCWMLDYAGGRFGAPALVPCPVRVEALEVPLAEGAATETGVGSAILTGIQGRLREIQRDNPGLRTLSLKVRLGGRCRPDAALAVIEPGLQDLPAFDGVAVKLLDRVEVACTAPIPLETWAARQGAPGRIARMVLSLQVGAADAEALRLIEAIRQEERDSRLLKTYLAVPDPLRDPETGGEAWARAQLLRSCWRILDEIWAMEAVNG